MKRYLIIICSVLFSVHCLAQTEQAQKATTYYFIRHAEKELSNTSDTDPHLTSDGYQRAQHWKEILQHIRFDAVYSTDFNRTKETGQPIATKNQLEIIIYSVSTSYDDSFKAATKEKTVLIVGHSNTIPNFVNAVIGNEKYQEIDDLNNGNLYIVTIADKFISDFLLTIN